MDTASDPTGSRLVYLYLAHPLPGRSQQRGGGGGASEQSDVRGCVQDHVQVERQPHREPQKALVGAQKTECRSESIMFCLGRVKDPKNWIRYCAMLQYETIFEYRMTVLRMGTVKSLVTARMEFLYISSSEGQACLTHQHHRPGHVF